MTDAMGNPIAIPGPSIKTAIDILEIEEPEERLPLFRQVKMISQTIAKELRKERKRTQDSRGNDNG